MKKRRWLTEEVAEFLASCPTRDELLGYRPSTRAQKRAVDLLKLSSTGQLSVDEQWELDQIEHIELLMQMIKARLNAEEVAAK